MTNLEIAIIVNVFITLSCYSYLFPISGTNQHRHPLSFSLFTDIQGLLILIVSIIFFGWIWGVILGIFLYFFSKTIFIPIAITMHLVHGINLIKQKIQETKFPWDTLTNSINFFWNISLFVLLILIIVQLIMHIT